MKQDDLFKMLMMMMLVCNHQEDGRHRGLDGCCNDNNGFTCLNDIMIIFFLLNSFNGNNGCEPACCCHPPVDCNGDCVIRER